MQVGTKLIQVGYTWKTDFNMDEIKKKQIELEDLVEYLVRLSLLLILDSIPRQQFPRNFPAAMLRGTTPCYANLYRGGRRRIMDSCCEEVTRKLPSRNLAAVPRRRSERWT